MSTELQFDRSAWAPPKDLTLTQWAMEHFVLGGTAAAPGRFRPFPYQPGIMDALTDPSVLEVTLKKSARVGATLIIDALVGYHIHQDPCPIMVLQPTEDDARGWGTEDFDPMIKASPELARIRFSRNTLEEKIFPGGVLQLASANSPTDLRRVSRRIVIGDERDAYPKSAGKEGDPWKLAKKRAEFYWNRKYYSASTPLFENDSAINDDFLRGDQRYFHVPCPLCGTIDKLVFSFDEKGGHFMQWPKGRPELAHYVCFHCSREIEAKKKRAIVEDGQWVITNPSGKTENIHASFHIWSAYSFSPNTSWGEIATEFTQASAKGAEALKTVVNTTFGECWKEQGDSPDWERIYNRRERYPVSAVPAGAVFLTCGVDVQKTSIRYEVVGWGAGMENWSVESGILWGDTATPDSEAFRQLDALLAQPFPGPGGAIMSIVRMAVDSGNFTQTVYQWCKRYPRQRVFPVKGSRTMDSPLITAPTKQEILASGRRVGNIMLWVVGVSAAKTELYGWLGQSQREDGTFPTGYCHFPDYGVEFFQELTSEYMVTELNKNRQKVRVWKVHPGRENHFLDCRNYARAAASIHGAERIPAKDGQILAAPAITVANSSQQIVEHAQNKPQQPTRSPPSWINGGVGLGGKGWLNR